MVKKSILSLVSVILGLSCGTLAGCTEKYDFQDVVAEFAQYPSDSNIAVVLDDYAVYFCDRKINLHDLIPDVSIADWHISRENIFFSAIDDCESKKQDKKNIVLYRCDLYGNDLQRIYEKKEVSRAQSLQSNNIFYFSYSLNEVKYIDSYDVLTDEIKNVVEGENCNIKDFQENKESKYAINCKNGKADILEKTSSEKFTVDENYLKTTPYYESVSKFPYNLEQAYETKERLFLFYRLKIEDFFEFSPDYTYALFEFSYETKEMTYKLLIQTRDVAVFDIYLL